MKNIIPRVIILADCRRRIRIQPGTKRSPLPSKVPFDFTAAGEAYTLGIYSSRKTLAVTARAGSHVGRSPDGSGEVIGMTRGQHPITRRKLVFVKNGLHYALKEVITPSFEHQDEAAQAVRLPVPQMMRRSSNWLSIESGWS
jgi:hypothetical protein